MLLRELAQAIPGSRLIGYGGVAITSIEYDSRAVGAGALFVAMPGFKVDGHAYLGRALESGARAIAVQEDHEAVWRPVVDGGDVEAIVLPDTRRGLARLSAAFCGHPARKLGVVGITGTDGKTSLAHLVAHVFNLCGQMVGLISTAECLIGDEPLPDTGRFTTPEAPQVQAMLLQMLHAGCHWAVIEATSHGLALHRVDECEYDIAAFTNVGSDHLDFHGGPDEYLAAKGRLFQMLDESADKGIAKTAVLHVGDPASAYFMRLTSAHLVSYGPVDPPKHKRRGDIRATDYTADGWGSRFEMQAPEGKREVRLAVPGRFNVENALAATAIGIAAGLSVDEIVTGLESWPGAPGRMERIDAGQPFSVIVDFAHSPDSLRRVLELLREMSRGRIIAVFGCIGERDRDRRPGMARTAAELADYTFVTDDNPYSEDRDEILEDIAAGLREAGKREGHDFAVVPDRREAIAQALTMAVDEDAVLLAGKGHEREVHLGDTEYPCDDREVSRAVLGEMGYGDSGRRHVIGDET